MKEKFIKLETHCHSIKVSPCADITLEQIAQKYKTAGYGGIVLTNHISPYSFSCFSLDTHKERVDFYLSPYHRLKEICAKENIKVFLGAEICAVNTLGYSEYMIYGFDEKFLYDNKPLFEYTQEELLRLCEKNNVFMYQTHPFRDGVVCGKSEFMHGAESFNGHFHHRNHNEQATLLCEKNGLVKMSGSDVHHLNQPVTGGIYIPDTINDNFELTNYIRNEKIKLIEEKKIYEDAFNAFLNK